jgi:molybdopterin converting factor subunit 1
MQVNVLLFAAAKEAAQSESITISVANQPTAADLLSAIGSEVPSLRALLPSCRLAVDNCYVGPQALIGENSEVALIPPVSGG